MLDAMAHRPYPVRGRALRQILRRHRNELPATLLLHTRRPADDGHVPQYVLSARRPRAAG
jgi:hypothetical protein